MAASGLSSSSHRCYELQAPAIAFPKPLELSAEVEPAES